MADCHEKTVAECKLVNQGSNMCTGKLLSHTCTTAVQVFGFAAALEQSGHMCVSTTYSTTKVCCSMAPLKTSLWTVSFVFSLREWGSVQMNPASTSLTCMETSFSE